MIACNRECEDSSLSNKGRKKCRQNCDQNRVKCLIGIGIGFNWNHEKQKKFYKNPFDGL